MADLDDPRITLAGLLFEATAAVSRATTPTLERHGLSAQWFECMIRLARSPGHELRMSELAASMTSITPSGLTRLVDRLVEVGYVRRRQCPSDRRGSLAVLTAEGLRKVRAVLPAHLADLQQHYVGVLSERESAQLERALRKVRDHDWARRCADAAGKVGASSGTGLDHEAARR